jgi:hypothetical protein
MKILIPIPVERRLPTFEGGQPFSNTVIVRYTNKDVAPDFSAQTFACCDKSGRWEESLPANIPELDELTFKPEGSNEVIEWYEEKDLEDLFPDDETSYRTAQNAGNGIIWKTAIHQEGQDFVKNFVRRQLKK